MKPSHVNILTGYSGWAFYCAVISVFGLTGYYADLLRPHVPDWIFVSIMIAPIVIILFIQWGEAPSRLVAAAHIFAASWFFALAAGMEFGILQGYNPRGSTFYRIFAHLGWIFAWAAIYRRAHSRVKDAEFAAPHEEGSGGAPHRNRESVK